VDEDIGERREAEDAADLDELRPVEEAPGRRDGKRDQKKIDRPVADPVDCLGDRPCAQAEEKGAVEEPEHRQGNEDERRRLERREAPRLVVPRQFTGDRLRARQGHLH
jgi:hypothetical protein